MGAAGGLRDGILIRSLQKSPESSMTSPTVMQLGRRAGNLFVASFNAMASPCEVLLATPDAALADQIGRAAAQEAWRIEQKFSRYRPDSVLSDINRSGGRPVAADTETLALFEFARMCHELSGGRFDVTSGILRKVWRFDGSDRVPDAASVDALLPLIGQDRLYWDASGVVVPIGMEVDLGGIAKEYAVDRISELIQACSGVPALVNLGGDLRAIGQTEDGNWHVGIERPDSAREAQLVLELSQGALATSGDTHRYLIKDGIRYGHILDPRSGWPVRGGPRSVTVAATTCLEAGMLATIALLHGAGAREFLAQAAVRHWCLE